MTKPTETEQRTPTHAQLHREACINCGTSRGPFVDAGHVHTRSVEGGRLGWAVVVCRVCRGAEP